MPKRITKKIVTTRRLLVEDRRSAYARRRQADVEHYFFLLVVNSVDKAIVEILALQLKKSPELPTPSHVKLAEMLRYRLLKRLRDAVRYA